MKFGLRTLLIGILGMCCWTFVACSGSTADSGTTANTKSVNTTSAANNSNAAATDYPQESVDAFMRSCEGTGSDKEFCTCVLSKVQAKYSYDEFVEIDSQIRSGKPSDEFVKFSETARKECAK